MNTRSLGLITLCSFLLLSVPQAHAGNGKGKGKGNKEKKPEKHEKKEKHEKAEKADKNEKAEKAEKHEKADKAATPGKGAKRIPPGIAKQGEEKIAKWLAAKNKRKAGIASKYRTLHPKANDTDIADVEDALDEAADAGAPVDEVADLIEKAMDKKIPAAEIKQFARALGRAIDNGAEPVEATKQAAKLVSEDKADARSLLKKFSNWAADKAADKLEE